MCSLAPIFVCRDLDNGSRRDGGGVAKDAKSSMARHARTAWRFSHHGILINNSITHEKVSITVFEKQNVITFNF